MKQWHLYQVVWDQNNATTLQREIRALKAAEQELNLKGQLMTPDDFIRWAISVDA